MPHPGWIGLTAYILFNILMFTTGHLWNFENINYVLLGVFAIGAYLIYYGFYQTKLKRQTEDIPTASIATGAVGSDVEIHGKVVVDEATALTAPLSGKPCAWYSLSVFSNVKGLAIDDTISLSGRFLRENRFYVDDGSGAYALVDPKGAKYTARGNSEKISINAENCEALLKKYPHFQKFVQRNKTVSKMIAKLNRSELVYGKAKIEVTEYSLTTGHNVYVMGYAQSALKKRWKPKLSFKNFLKAKKQIEGDQALASRFDKNRDGTLDPDELEAGARTLGLQYESEGASGKDIQRRRFKEKVKMVFEHSRTHPLTVYTGKGDMEAEMVQGMQENAKIAIRGGSALCIFALILMVYFLFIK